MKKSVMFAMVAMGLGLLAYPMAMSAQAVDPEAAAEAPTTQTAAKKGMIQPFTSSAWDEGVTFIGEGTDPKPMDLQVIRVKIPQQIIQQIGMDQGPKRPVVPIEIALIFVPIGDGKWKVVPDGVSEINGPSTGWECWADTLGGTRNRTEDSFLGSVSIVSKSGNSYSIRFYVELTHAQGELWNLEPYQGEINWFPVSKRNYIWPNVPEK